MKVLIIGGTRFVGRHLTARLLVRGHNVTHFNRGRTASDAVSGVQIIRGDRVNEIERIGDTHWDAVVDTCGYTPDVVERSVRFLAPRTSAYLFVSTISVYDETRTDGPDEEAPTHVLPAGADPTQFAPQYYGALKALCEAVVRSTFRHRAIVLRPGLIAGPFDPTDRFTYWPVRVAAGGRVLAPVGSGEEIMYIDARDVAEFAVALLERHSAGVYNCVTPKATLTFGDLFEACVRTAGSNTAFVWASREFLSEHHVEAWSDLPLWIPKDDPSFGIMRAQSARAAVQGLHVRSLAHTVRDTLEWAQSIRKVPWTLKAGLDPAREAQLLTAYQESRASAVK